MPHFRSLRGCEMGVCNTPLKPGMCDSSKYRCDSPTEYVWSFKKLSRFHPFRGRGVGRIQYAPTTGYVRSFEIQIQFRDWVCVRVQKTDLYTPPSVAYGGAYSIRPYDRIRAILRNTDAIFQLDTCGHSKNCPVFVSFGAVCGAYTIRPYNRVRVILRNTDVIPQLGTCCPSKNCPIFVPFGAACVAYSIRPYDRISSILRNTDAIFQLNTYGPSKNYLVFVPFGAVCGAYSIRPYNWVRAILRNTDAIS